MSSSNTECQAILADISAYLDGDLDRIACDAIDAHCGTCASCAGIVDGLRQTLGLCRQVADTPLPDAVRERARESLRNLLDRVK
jgi:anti-sigma factor RsiW